MSPLQRILLWICKFRSSEVGAKLKLSVCTLTAEVCHEVTGKLHGLDLAVRRLIIACSNVTTSSVSSVLLCSLLDFL